MTSRSFLVCPFVVLACLLSCWLARPAFAQGYDVTEESGQFVPPTPTATGLGLGDDATTTVTLPFTFVYFGQGYTDLTISSNGWAAFLPSGAPSPGSQPNNPTFPQSSVDGVLAPHWDDLDTAAGNGTGDIFVSTLGNAPERSFVITWNDLSNKVDPLGRHSFQVRLDEKDGRIVFSYAPVAGFSLWFGNTYSSGIEAPGTDTRFVTPDDSNSNTKTGRPGTDFEFTPRTFDVTATVLFDKLVVDSTGIGNTLLQDRPVGGVPFVIRAGDGREIARTHADPLGNITFLGVPEQPGNGTLEVSLDDLDPLVEDTELRVLQDLEFGTGQGPDTPLRTVALDQDHTLGTIQINNALDPGAALREPLNIFIEARRVQGRFEPLIDTPAHNGILIIGYQSNGSSDELYVPPASQDDAGIIHIQGAGTDMPSAWQDNIIHRVVLRHMVCRATDVFVPSTEYSNDLLGPTTVQNALLGGLCEALATQLATPPRTTALFLRIPEVGPLDPQVFDFENPTLQVTPGPTVGGAWAAAFFDIMDPANEPDDRLDGVGPPSIEFPTGGPRDIELFKVLTAPALSEGAPGFAYQWRVAGEDPAGLSRTFTHWGLVPADAFEKNDDENEAADLGDVGLRVQATLPIGDTDVFQGRVGTQYTTSTNGLLTVNGHGTPTGTPAGTIRIRGFNDLGVHFDQTFVDPGPRVELDGVFDASAGTWFLRIDQQDGSGLDYGLELFQPLAQDGPLLQPWTINQPFDQPLGIRGGVRDLVVGLDGDSDPLPNGLDLSGPIRDLNDVGALRGIPTVIGTSNLKFVITDSASPPNEIQFESPLTINPPPSFFFPGTQHPSGPNGCRHFGVDAAGDRLSIGSLGIGGTAPFVQRANNPLFAGGSIEASPDGTFRYNPGLITEPLEIDFEIQDAAGAEAHHLLCAVPCDPLPGNGKLELPTAEGDDIVGTFFFAPAGSLLSGTLSLKENEAPAGEKKPRANVELGAVFFLLPDAGSNPSQTETMMYAFDGPGKRASAKATKKGFVLKNIVLPGSGGYFVTAHKTLGGPAVFKAKLKISPPKGDNGTADDFGPGSETLEVCVGAFEGADLKFSVKTDKKAGNLVVIQGLQAPDGTVIDGSSLDIKTSKTKQSFKATLDQFGTWKILLDGGEGPVGALKYKAKVKQPKGVKFTTD